MARASIFAFPYDVEAVNQLAKLRAHELDPQRIVEHLRRVEADVADAVTDHLRRREGDLDQLAVVVTARCIAAAVFAAMEAWMLRDERTLADLAALSNDALTALENGPATDGMFRHY